MSLGKSDGEVVVEFAPVVGEVDCTPAAWNLREIRGVDVRVGCGRE